MASLIQQTFTKGEVSPEVAARTDISAYYSGLARCINFIVSPYGGVLNRAGTYFIAGTPNNKPARLIRFKFSSKDTYAVELTAGLIRFYRNGGLVLYPSGHPDEGQVVSLVSPYQQNELAEIRFTQTADVMDLVHPNHRPRKLRRFDHHDWTLTEATFVPAVAAPASATATGEAGSSAIKQTWRFQITAVIDDGSRVTEESLPVTSNSVQTGTDRLQATVTWAAVTGATYYNVYKDNAGAGIYGFVGRATTTSFTDNNIVPAKADAPPDGIDPFVGEGHYPCAVAYFQQRICYAGTDARPQTLWFSRTGVPSNFGYSFPTKDDDAITWTMASGEVNRVMHLVPIKSLMTFTDGSEWIIRGQASGFTTKTINGDAQTYNGIGWLRPLVINDDVVYTQERGRTVSAFGYKLESDGYSGNEISVLSSHLFEEYGIADWDYQKIPYSHVWASREDGQMVGLTYMSEHQVIGWSRHVTDGRVVSVCAVPEGREDSVYLCVERIIEGEARYYVERMASRTLPRSNGDISIQDMCFLDCSLKYDGRNKSGVTITLTDGGAWQSPDRITMSASDDIFSPGDVAREYQILRSSKDPLRLVVTDYVSPSVVEVRPVGVVPESLREVPIQEWGRATNRVSGLDHLEGKSVTALADGSVERGYVVSDGAIDLQSYSVVVLVGLPYESEIKTLELSMSGQETLMDKIKTVRSMTVVFNESRGGWYGGERESDLFEIKSRDVLDDYGALPPISGKYSLNITTGIEGNGSVRILQRDPLPMSILAVIPYAEVGPVRR